MNKVIIYGASGHAKVILTAIKEACFNVVALIDQNPDIKSLNGYIVYSSIEALLKETLLDPLTENIYFIIAIGGDKGAERINLHEKLVEFGFKPTTIIHPNAWVDPTAIIGEGSQILTAATISAEVIIGRQTIINTGAIVDHETQIGDGCHVMPGAVITGCVTIQNFCTIGSNATILPRLKMVSYTVLGAGAVLTRNFANIATLVGIPAKEIKTSEWKK